MRSQLRILAIDVVNIDLVASPERLVYVVLNLDKVVLYIIQIRILGVLFANESILRCGDTSSIAIHELKKRSQGPRHSWAIFYVHAFFILKDIAFLVEAQLSALIFLVSVILKQILVYLHGRDMPFIILEIEAVDFLGQF